MKKLYFLSLLLGISFILASCESNEPQKFLVKDTFVSFNRNTASMNENDTEPIQIPLILAGIPGGPAVNVKLSISTEGIAIPAVEGVDYTISSKEFNFESGCGTQYVVITPIDNDQFTGNKSFYLSIESTTPELLESVQSTVRVIINDDDHPLSNMFGSYMIAGTNPFDQAGYAVNVVAHSDGADNELAFDFGFEKPVIAMVFEEDGETYLNFYKDQNLGVAQGYDVHFVWTLSQDGKLYYNTKNNIYALYEDDKLTFTTDLYGESGFGFLAFNGSSPYAWFEFWAQDVTMTKIK